MSTEAAKEASKNGGITVGVAGGKNKNVFGDFRPTILINTGLEIGGGREFSLVLSCDVVIAISGGSGTLTEIAIAYQAGIPIIVVDKFEGWAKKLSDKYIDDRIRNLINANPNIIVEAKNDLAQRYADQNQVESRVNSIEPGLNSGGGASAVATGVAKEASAVQSQRAEYIKNLDGTGRIGIDEE